MAKLSTLRKRTNLILLVLLVVAVGTFFGGGFHRQLVGADFWSYPSSSLYTESQYGNQYNATEYDSQSDDCEVDDELVSQATVRWSVAPAAHAETKSILCPTKQTSWYSPFFAVPKVKKPAPPLLSFDLESNRSSIFDGLNPYYRQLKPSPSPSPVPQLSQNNPRWANVPYGPKTISCAGCGPTSAAMVLRYYGYQVTPPEIGALAVKNGFYEGKGTEWAFFPFAAKKYGLQFDPYFEYDPVTADPLDRDAYWKRIVQHLQAGHPVILSGKGPAPFTQGGHFIVLTRANSNGTIRVNDPNDENGDYPISYIKPYFRFVGVMYR